MELPVFDMQQQRQRGSPQINADARRFSGSVVRGFRVQGLVIGVNPRYSVAKQGQSRVRREHLTLKEGMDGRLDGWMI
ncbi:MAG: hypothetical protein NTV22_17775, partial [bacterium]|nr:hypothetical protein [bacterium]